MKKQKKTESFAPRRDYDAYETYDRPNRARVKMQDSYREEYEEEAGAYEDDQYDDYDDYGDSDDRYEDYDDTDRSRYEDYDDSDSDRYDDYEEVDSDLYDDYEDYGDSDDRYEDYDDTDRSRGRSPIEKEKAAPCKEDVRNKKDRPRKGTQKKHKEHFIAGLFGALLFSLIGAAAYFGIYQLGYIAGICGLITYLLSYLGYRLFSRAKHSRKGIVVSVLFTVIILFAAEYLCTAYEIYKAFISDYQITFWDAFIATPSFLREPELMAALIEDLGISYLLCILASVPTIISSWGKKK